MTGAIQISSGSYKLLEWIFRGVIRAHHSLYMNNGSWGCRISGQVTRNAISQMYLGSTPETRLKRKYDRLMAAEDRYLAKQALRDFRHKND